MHESAEALPSVLDLATASGLDLAQASDIMTDTMSMFGIESDEASRASDVFAAAQANSNLSVDQLSEALIKAGPTAAALGEDIEETSAMLGIFADQGLKGSKAGTTLDAMYRDVQNAAEDGAIAIGESSIAVYDAEGNFRGMSAIMAEVEAATEGMSDEQRRNALASVFQEQAMGGVNMLLAEGSDGLAELTDTLYNSEGAANEMAETMDDNVQGALAGLRSSIEEVAIQFFELGEGPIRGLIEWLTNLVDRFGELDGATQQWIVLAALAAAAIGPILIVGAKLVKGVLMVIKVAKLLVVAVGAITAPFAAVVAAIAAAIAIGVALWKNWDEVTAKAGEMHERVQTAVQTMVAAVVNFFTNLGERVRSTVQNMVTAVVSFFTNLGSRARSIISTMVSAVVNFFTNLGARARAIVSSLVSSVVSFFSNLGTRARAIISAMVTGVVNFFTNMFNSTRNIANNIKSTITNIFNSFANIVRTAFSRVVSNVRNGMTRAFNVIKGFFSRFKNAGANIIGNVADGIRGAVGKVTDAVGGVLGKARDMLPFSPPKDKSSPLAGIEKNGITEQIAKGIYDGENEIDKAMNNVLGGGAFDVNAHATHSVDNHENGYQSRPAVINMNLGGRNFKAFVEDISNTQNNVVRLETEYGL